MTFPQIVGGFEFDDEVKQKIWWQYKVPEWFFLSPPIIIWLLFILQFSILSLSLSLCLFLSLHLMYYGLQIYFFKVKILPLL